MLKENTNLFFRLFNIWFAFNVLLLFSSYLPHWPNVKFLSWVNVSIYFLLFLLASSILLRERHNKDIYLNLSFCFLGYSLSFLNIFIGEDFLIGNNYTLYYVFVFRKIILGFLFNFVIVYIVLKYLLMNQKTWILYLITLIISLTFCVFTFLPYISNPDIIFTFGNGLFADFSKRALRINGLSILFLVIYVFSVYKTDRLLSKYLNQLMAFFGILVVADFVDNLSQVHNFRIFTISLYILTPYLIFILTTLLFVLFFLCSEYGQFYEALINKEINIGKVKIKRHRSEMNARILDFFKLYFYRRRNYLFGLGLVTAILFVYFQFPTFFTIQLTALLFCVTGIFCFVNILYKKRSKRKYTLH